MKTAHRAPVVVALLAIGAFAAMGQKERSRHFESTDAVLAQVPEKAREKRNPLADDAAAVPAGEKLFEQHCAECHGRDAEGTRRGPDLRDKQVRDASPGELFWILTNGLVRHGMPAWSKLPGPQRWQIVTFLRAQKPKAP